MNPSTLSHDLDRIAVETGFSPAAVRAMDDALRAGWGSMAQFRHPEFGGAGQWMRGGLLMTADPSDRALAARIGDLCDRLSGSRTDDDDLPAGGLFDEPGAPGSDALPARSSRAWPASLGVASSSGAQDGIRYAVFPATRRLAIDRGGDVAVYDTADHRIGGVSQQQGDTRSLAFTSQHGTVALDRLRRVDDASDASLDAVDESVASRIDPSSDANPPAVAATLDPFAALERLADLHARGIVDATEFAAKKAELLRRI